MCNTVDKQIVHLQSQLDELKALREKEEVKCYPKNRKRPAWDANCYVLTRHKDKWGLFEVTYDDEVIDKNRWESGALFNKPGHADAHLHVLNTIMKDPEWIYWFPGMQKPNKEDVACLETFNSSGSWSKCPIVEPNLPHYFWSTVLATYRYKYKEG